MRAQKWHLGSLLGLLLAVFGVFFQLRLDHPSQPVFVAQLVLIGLKI